MVRTNRQVSHQILLRRFPRNPFRQCQNRERKEISERQRKFRDPKRKKRTAGTIGIKIRQRAGDGAQRNLRNRPGIALRSIPGSLNWLIILVKENR